MTTSRLRGAWSGSTQCSGRITSSAARSSTVSALTSILMVFNWRYIIEMNGDTVTVHFLLFLSVRTTVRREQENGRTGVQLLLWGSYFSVPLSGRSTKGGLYKFTNLCILAFLIIEQGPTVIITEVPNGEIGVEKVTTKNHQKSRKSRKGLIQSQNSLSVWRTFFVVQWFPCR